MITSNIDLFNYVSENFGKSRLKIAYIRAMMLVSFTDLLHSYRETNGSGEI